MIASLQGPYLDPRFFGTSYKYLDDGGRPVLLNPDSSQRAVFGVAAVVEQNLSVNRRRISAIDTDIPGWTCQGPGQRHRSNQNCCGDSCRLAVNDRDPIP
jgi:hypothetical protein